MRASASLLGAVFFVRLVSIGLSQVGDRTIIDGWWNFIQIYLPSRVKRLDNGCELGKLTTCDVLSSRIVPLDLEKN